MRDAIEQFILSLEKSDKVKVEITVTKDQLQTLGLSKIKELANKLINREYNEKRNNLGVQNPSKARS